MINKEKAIVKINSTNTSGVGELSITAKTAIKSVLLVVESEQTGENFSFEFTGVGTQANGKFVVPEPLLWSTYTPSLYAFRVTVSYENGEAETQNGKFGFRVISTDGKYVTLNGTPIFLRGFIRGIKCHDHKNNCNLSEYDFYKKNLTQAKKFGFNLVRFHSTVPPKTLFEVADEVGMLIHIELRPENDEYNNLEEMLFTTRDLVPEEFVQGVINDLYNHPSLAVYCIGNELKALGKPERIVELGSFIKKEDPTRLFVDTCAWGEKDRPNVDIDVQHMSYYFPFGKHANMFDNVKSIHTYEKFFKENEGAKETLSVPLIAHEVCHYTALRDFVSLKEKFIRYGADMPWWIDEELKMIEAKGLNSSYKNLYEASRNFQSECWKTALESIRSSRILSGFHMLQFSDTDVYENSNGVVDCFDDVSCVTPEFFNVFNGDNVLLTDISSRQYRSGQQAVFPIKYSNFSERQDEFATLSFSLFSSDGKCLSEKVFPSLPVSKRGLYELCKVTVNLPDTKSQELTVSVTLKNDDDIICSNSWKIWVYEWKRSLSYDEFTNFKQDDTIITKDIANALAQLKKGKKVCLVYRNDWTRHVANKTMDAPKYALKATWNRFKPVIWDRGTNYGGLCENELLNKYGFASGKYYDFNYCFLTEDCDKIILDDFPTKVRSIVSGTDKNVRDRFDAYTYSFNLPELQYDRTLRNFSYLFEVAVGTGKLLVCGMNMTGLDKNEPSTNAMANFIIDYILSSEFAPKERVDFDCFEKYMKDCALAPVKERMMTQFWQLDNTPVESKQYWIESREYLKY